MTRKPPDHPPPGVSKLLLALCLIASFTVPATAQQQQSQRLSRSVQFSDSPSRGKSTWVENVNADLRSFPEADRDDSQSDDGLPDQTTQKADSSPNPLHSFDAESAQSPADARAVIQYAPVERSFRDPVRASARPAPQQSGGLSPRLTARSLQDWKVEDIVLLATVDGKIHARNRNTGAQLWALEADRPMVETIYHPKNSSADDSSPDTSASDFLWIIEPSQDGALYGYKPGSGLGLQNLHLTVKQIVEDTPHLSEDPPVIYVAEKRNTLYNIDIATGEILKVYTTTSAIVNDPGVCRQLGELDALDDDKCGAIGTLTLTRTEYTLAISNHGSRGGQICTIKYSEWGPNNRDRDLHQQYLNSKNGRYIHSRHNGEIYAIDHKSRQDSASRIEQKPIFWKKLPSPVARVFDVARPLHSTSLDTPLVLLPQPFDPILALKDNGHVFVNRTETGSWYALSEMIYPLVTGGAFMAPGEDKNWFRDDDLPVHLTEALVGVHAISFSTPFPGHVPAIGPPPQPPTIQPPFNNDVGDTQYGGPSQSPDRQSVGFNYTQFLLTILILILSGYGVQRTSLPATLTKRMQLWRSKDVTARTLPGDHESKSEPDKNAMADENDINMETESLPPQPEKTVKFEEPSSDLKNEEAADEGDDTLVLVETNGDNDNMKKGKARRGKRGGKRLAEKRALKASIIPEGIDDSLDTGKNVSVQPDIIYQKENDPKGAPEGLLNLEIQTDRILGHGSGGTLVFEGKFEGRDVAVKRMLGQYSELASQEVSLLEQSEDHPNVIRYFCRRQDEHFLYIALELCQASLWELYRDGRREDVAEKFRPLADEINSQPHRVLRQLAEGLKHLHSFRIVHRDIKPQNMLIAYPKKHTVATFPRLVISDFGLCKTLPEGASTLIGATVNAGTIGWKAPELISQPKDAFGNAASNHSTGRDSANGDSSSILGIKRSTDIFALGCVFFYVLTGGLHPFDDEEGWMGIRERNIKANRCNLDAISIQGPDTVDLIKWMLEPNPEDRPTAAEVLAHPFFWNAEDRLEFLSLASDRFDMEARDGTSLALSRLESCAEDIIGAGPSTLNLSSASASSRYNTSTANGHHRSASSHSDTFSSMTIPIPGEPNFLAALDKKFIDTLGKQRKYQGHKVVDLLRALRNKHHHWDDMPDDVKAKVGAVPEGYLGYWERKFPHLTVSVWRVVKALHMDNERRFWRWYGGRVDQ